MNNNKGHYHFARFYLRWLQWERLACCISSNICFLYSTEVSTAGLFRRKRARDSKTSGLPIDKWTCETYVNCVKRN